MEQNSKLSLLEDIANQNIEKVSLLGIDKNKTTCHNDLFQIYLMLSPIPEKFWLGCFEQVQNEMYKRDGLKFRIVNNQCIITTAENQAQELIDELKTVIDEANKMFNDLILEAIQEAKRIKQELEENKRRIEELHSKLVI